MENHVRLLGLLNIAVGVLNGLIAIFQFLFFGSAVSMAAWIGVNTVVAGVWLWTAVVLMVPGIVTGIALLSFREWARTAGILLCVFQMMLAPFGTVVALYGLWVLFSDAADMIFTRRFGQYTITRKQP